MKKKNSTKKFFFLNSGMCQRLGGIVSDGYDAWANYYQTELIIGYSNFPSDSSDDWRKRFISSRSKKK
jgi:hypothetical protein